MTERVYQVPSRTKAGVFWRVVLRDDGTSDCNCPHSYYRRAHCDHQAAAKLLETEHETLKAAPTPVTAW